MQTLAPDNNLAARGIGWIAILTGTTIAAHAAA